MSYYGYGSPDEVKETIVRVCSRFHTPDLRVNLISGIIAVETQFGTYPDRSVGSGIGIMQFDPIAFEDVKINTNRIYKELVWREFDINIDLVELCCLRYDIHMNIIFGVLKLLRIPEILPLSIEGEAQYWKKYWNTRKGAGTIQDYLDARKHWSHLIEGD